MAERRAIAQPHHQVGGTARVVGDLLQHLGGNRRHAFVGRPGQADQQEVVPGVEQELARHGVAIVAIGPLDQQQVAELRRIAQVGQPVLVAPGPLDLAGQRQPHAGLAQQVERGIGQRQVLFQHGPVAAPLAQALRQHQGGVAQPQQVLKQ
ncbi:phenylacetic acid degradation PaaI domain protein [Bordetella bronchiseptica]|nr:phenylacetic acid degradation PaaI domain protein [Bordetella bronchiseptica]